MDINMILVFLLLHQVNILVSLNVTSTAAPTVNISTTKNVNSKTTVLVSATLPNVTITTPGPTAPPVWNGKSTIQEKKIKAGEKFTFDCGDYSSFKVDLNWKKDKEVLKGNKHYVLHNTGEPKKRYLTIEEVKYSDRANFSCTVTKGNETVTHYITLRVRDPLGALWPFLGIVIEAVILFISIALYEHQKKKSNKKKLHEGGVTMSEVQDSDALLEDKTKNH